MTGRDLLRDDDVRALHRAIAALPLFIQGSVSTVARRCGRPGCHCTRDPAGHPTRYLTYKRDGTTRTVYLPDDTRGRLIQEGIAHYQRLLALVQAMTDTVTAKLRGRPWPVGTPGRVRRRGRTTAARRGPSS